MSQWQTGRTEGHCH